ncbi:MAG: type IV pilus twitching motility protein PilT [Candidatus Omnitrophica bacterium]|nr:type IV pilus twitching motility protein PilT [Candidatus Omnitrophota bacterium]MBU4478808.1 type IV pilus twitching motility protein PilT [Candidatus Omnitrophota bacterium]MCG2702879.1 type IV pilus twitching motility protein PilT [Candidatus Omnitrophota bacterium]
MTIFDLIDEVTENSASDLHLVAGAPPAMRINGNLIFSDKPKLTPDEVRQLCFELINEERKVKFEKEKELDFSYSYLNQKRDLFCRFRVNLYVQRNSPALALRFIDNKILTFGDLGLPPILKDIARQRRGLILVTGATGSGKSTTLAAIVDLINKERNCHIITLEDPIEFFHSHQKSLVSQREIGQDTASFALALREALRQDPDVILVGEMRDLETISIAITAAETGHLVLATLHTTDAVQTIDRIIDVFPPHQQQQVRTQISITLQAVVSQQLVLNAEGKKRIPVVEIMLVNSAIRNLIREGKTYQIYSVIETCRDQGMQTLDQALHDLINRKVIEPKEAFQITHNPETLKKKLGTA